MEDYEKAEQRFLSRLSVARFAAENEKWRAARIYVRLALHEVDEIIRAGATEARDSAAVIPVSAAGPDPWVESGSGEAETSHARGTAHPAAGASPSPLLDSLYSFNRALTDAEELAEQKRLDRRQDGELSMGDER